MINDQRTHREEQPAVNLGQARKKEETKEEKRARKQQIKEARKVCANTNPPKCIIVARCVYANDVLTPGISLYMQANRERKKEIKGAFKEEELRQLNMQAKGQGQRVIRLK